MYPIEQIFPSIDTHREKRVELGVLIEPTTSACYGSVWPEAAPLSTRPRMGGLGWEQAFDSVVVDRSFRPSADFGAEQDRTLGCNCILVATCCFWDQ